MNCLLRNPSTSIARATSAVSLFAFVLLVILTQMAVAQGFSVLYDFSGGVDGKYPYSRLMLVNGEVYGTTHEGGALGYGTIFKVNASGTETVLYSFAGSPDGAYPYAGLLHDAAGNLYGTTKAGGVSGYGTVFKLDANGTESVLHSFGGGTDGASPYAGVIRDAVGNLYGTTSGGQPDSRYGTVFTIDSSGTETVLYGFTSTSDGGNPGGILARDGAGNLYGTAGSGGVRDSGLVFKLDTEGIESALYTFSGKNGDPIGPSSGLIRDDQGNFYGTSIAGGTHRNGTVYRVNTKGRETVLYSFAGGSDGAGPSGELVLDSKGRLYGTTVAGGAANFGTVFMLSGIGKEKVLYTFTGGADGGRPVAGLVRDAAGNLYGSASRGGKTNHGVIFKIKP